MKLPPTSSANTATRNDAQAKEADRKREPPAMVDYHTIPSQNVTDADHYAVTDIAVLRFQTIPSQNVTDTDHYAVTDIGVLRFQTIMHLRLWKKGSDSRPLCSYGDWSVQTPDQSCTYGYGRAWTLHHYAV
ncbi:unnamed protein product [Sphagnum jensenii]|uniref:Uncharacterized protein n=1 Tax=Sphagnum jensenii TaxID=128206 RepID=A0ABP1BEE9_9BRYO